MREIKFRAWDTDKKAICVPQVQCNFNSGCYDINSLFAEHSSQFVWMQFTGLKDKNGKEIYEGDLLLNNEERWKVYSDEGGYWMSLSHQEAGQHKFIFINEAQHSEVIGNIYENPELLNSGSH